MAVRAQEAKVKMSTSDDDDFDKKGVFGEENSGQRAPVFASA